MLVQSVPLSTAAFSSSWELGRNEEVTLTDCSSTIKLDCSSPGFGKICIIFVLHLTGWLLLH